MVKDKNRCTIKDTMSTKISFMHYRNHITWTRVMLPVVLEEFDIVYIFWLLFTFHYYCQLVKGHLYPKSGRGDCSPPAPPPPPPLSTALYMVGTLVFTRFVSNAIFLYHLKTSENKVPNSWWLTLFLLSHFSSLVYFYTPLRY